MDLPNWSITQSAGLILILSFIFQFPGLMLFWLRGGVKGGAPRSRAHFIWERSFIRLSPRDIYFPILHSVMPLLIGIALFFG